MSMISIHVPGRPIASARAHSNGAHRYTPEPQASYMAAVGTIARVAMAKAAYEPFEGPLEVFYRATFAWPKTWSKLKRERTRWKSSAPDADNLVKGCMDSLSGIVFRDDAQVASIKAEKVYGPNEFEGVVMTIVSLTASEASI